MPKVMIQPVLSQNNFRKRGFNTTCLPQTLYANLTKWVMGGGAFSFHFCCYDNSNFGSKGLI